MIDYDKQKILIERMKETINGESLFNWLGISIRRKNHKEIRAKCPIHGGKNDTSLSFQRYTKKWKCFSKSCEREYGGDVLGLIRSVYHCTFVEALKVLSQITGIDVGEEVDEKQFVQFTQEKISREVIRDVELQTKKLLSRISDRRVNRKGQEYFLNRGFTNEVLDYFDVGGMYNDVEKVPRVVIPINDDRSRFVGTQGRRVDEIEDVKYRTEGFEKGEILYNLDKAKKYLGLPPVLILVEGVTDVWTLWMMDYYNVVSSLGTGVAPSQIKLLIKYAMNVIVLFDGDSSGKKGFKSLREEGGMGLGLHLLKLPDGVDPASADKIWLSKEIEKVYYEIGVKK